MNFSRVSRFQLIRFLQKKTNGQSCLFSSATEATGSQAKHAEEPLVMPGTGAGTEEKTFDPKLHEIVNRVEKLTLLEVSELNQLLKKRLNIPDAPVMSMAAMSMGPGSANAAAAAEGEAEEPKAVKSAYNVRLIKFDETKKVGLIKEIKGLVSGLNLVQAKKFVESVPQIVKSDLTKEEADKLKAQLESLGATIAVD